MAIDKKHGKGRLDKWYKLAKEKGYRARAAFKLVQLNRKYGFLEKSKVVLDLCAAPGSWCQVCSETMPKNSLIIGVDLAPIKPIPGVITFQSDITSDKCRATIRGHLKAWKADAVLHDGAPNVGTAWAQDSFNQAELALHSLKLATEFLVEGGTFVTKVFRSKDYNPLIWVFNQLFAKVEATKPPSSRNVSAEIFVVCRGFKAPKRIDPRLLDARSVFKELADPAQNNEAKVYNPEVKKRRREGYDEGDYTQFKAIPASEFIQTTDPIAILGQYNRLTFEQPRNGDVALAALDKLPETTPEIRGCCADLKLLGRKDFKLLLKWRLRVREIFGFPSKKTAAAAAAEEEVAEVEPMDEELGIQNELQQMKERQDAKKKREKRKDNEKKQREIVRMQMNMVAPMDIAADQDGPRGEDAMFRLKSLEKANAPADAARRIARGKMAVLSEAPAKPADHDSGLGSSGEADDDDDDDDDDESDEEEDHLERELDGMYEQYRERKAESDAKYRAKRARKEHNDDEWEGVSASEQGDDSDAGRLDEDSSDDDESDFDEDESAPPKSLLRDLDGGSGPAAPDGLSKRARVFFNQEVFKDIPGLLDLPEEEEDPGELDDDDGAEDQDDENPDASSDDDIPTISEQKRMRSAKARDSESKDDKSFEVVKGNEDDDDDDDDDDDWEEHDKRRKDGRPDIEIITAEAMSLAHQLATGQKTKHDVIDESFNKHAFRDRDGLPDWFAEDESKHDKPHRPISKAAAQAVKEKMRALNARPIKKVREARARKKMKAAARLEKLKKKGEELVASEGLTEREKADQVAKLMRRAGRKTPRKPVTVVRATGLTKGKGRPKGVRGRYKMVDPRMKKEMRAMKRLKAKKKR